MTIFTSFPSSLLFHPTLQPPSASPPVERVVLLSCFCCFTAEFAKNFHLGITKYACGLNWHTRRELQRAGESQRSWKYALRARSTHRKRVSVCVRWITGAHAQRTPCALSFARSPLLFAMEFLSFHKHVSGRCCWLITAFTGQEGRGSWRRRSTH